MTASPMKSANGSSWICAPPRTLCSGASTWLPACRRICTPRTIWPAPPGASCSLRISISNCMSFLKPAGVRMPKFLGSSSRLMSMILSIASDMTFLMLRDNAETWPTAARPFRFLWLMFHGPAEQCNAGGGQRHKSPLPRLEIPITIGKAQQASSEAGRAESRKEPPSHPGRPRHADGRASAPLLDADRRRERTRQEPDQARSPHGRGSRALQGPERTFRAPRPALPPSTRGSLLWIRRGDRHPLQLPRLADGRDRPLHRAALRRHRQPALARQGALLDQGLSGEGMRGALMDLYGAAADAGTAGVGAVHVGERLSRSRALRRSLQLVPVPGELLRPRALRVDARQLEPAAER